MNIAVIHFDLYLLEILDDLFLVISDKCLKVIELFFFILESELFHDKLLLKLSFSEIFLY